MVGLVLLCKKKVRWFLMGFELDFLEAKKKEGVKALLNFFL
jgi:hypothetical protein